MSHCETPRTAAVTLGRPRWRDRIHQAIAAERGNAAALIEAYCKHGFALEKYVGGHFCLALLDKADHRAFLASDRFGTHPLYYHRPASGGLIFGTSASLVLNHARMPAVPSPQSFYDYVYFHMVPSPATSYTGLHRLEPGRCLEYDNGRSELRYYWKPEFADRDGFDALATELMGYLETSIRRSHPDDATGAFLSGGLDSSTVAGLLSKVMAGPVKSYSIGFSADGYDEIEYARIAARHFGLDMHQYYVTPDDVAEAIPEIAEAYEEPFGNSSAVPVLFCAKLARENDTKVLLAGDGGDELFAGNARYVKQKKFSIYDRLPAMIRSRVLEPSFLQSERLNKIPSLEKIGSYIRQASLPMPDRMESYNMLNRTPASAIFAAEFLTRVDPDHPLKHLREIYERAAGQSLVDRMLYLDWKITLADNDLRKVGRMCELAGVEVRYPMLDDDLVDFSLQVPASWKIKGFKLRYFYKQALKGFLPDEILQKKKHGFGLPFGEWLRTSPRLQELAYDSLHTLKGRGIVRPDFIDQLVHRHRHDHAAYYGATIWVLVMLEQWFQRHGPALTFG
jgi:asparagine synthase (glutamine-hydrolysing)